MFKRSFHGRVAGFISALVLASSCGGGDIGEMGGVREREPTTPPTDAPGDPSDLSCSAASPDVGASNGWRSTEASQPAVGELYFEVKARASAENLNGLMAVGGEGIDEFSKAAIAVRFAESGLVDARDGAAYDSDVPCPYEQGVWYKIAVTADIDTETYDVEIGRCDEPLETLIENASFRSDADVAAQLNSWAVWSSQTAPLEVSTPMWLTSGGCSPATCESLGATCGSVSDGCGGTLSCGSCGSGEQCSSGICVDVPSGSGPPPGSGGDPDQPWAHNTGPTDRDVLRPMSGTNITVDGTVLEDFFMNGELQISADNVTVRNCHIDCGSALAGSLYCVRVHGGVKDFLIEDCELEGAQSAPLFSTSSVTARRLHVHDSGGDAFKIEGGGPSLIEYSFVEKIGVKPDAHADGNQSRGGANITFRYNNIFMPHPGTPNYPGAPYKSNAAFMISGGTTNFTIDRNWLNGGSYTIYCESSGSIHVTNNRFGRDNARWADGREGARIRSGNCTTWAGNVWDDTGQQAP